MTTIAPMEPPRYALLGVCGSDLAAIGVLDRVLGRGGHPDSRYHKRREGIFISRSGRPRCCVDRNR